MTDNPKTHSKEHLFSLVRLKPQCRFQPTFVDFEPLFPSSSSGGSIVPVFNGDGNHFTPAFLLPSEKRAQAKGLSGEKLLFEHRVRQTILSSDSSNLYDLTPSSNYCQICHEYFKNYDQHLEQKTHQLRWEHNEFNEDIRQLCQKIEESEKESSLPTKHKAIKKREKNDTYGYGVKHSPKTTVENYPKRKMSSISQEGSLQPTHISESFPI